MVARMGRQRSVKYLSNLVQSVTECSEIDEWTIDSMDMAALISFAERVHCGVPFGLSLIP